MIRGYYKDMNTSPRFWRKHRNGCSRYSNFVGDFGQVKKVGRKWHAEIRSNAGDILQYAGIWNTRKDAREEVEFILQDRHARRLRRF